MVTPVGGHSAPPRGRMRLGPTGEPVYGPRDHADASKVAELGLPFWLAGGYAGPHGLARALLAGATGIQVGTAFALCRESGLDDALRRDLLRRAADVYTARPRLCDLGHLRTPYLKPDGTPGYRCPAEPVDAHIRKGRTIADTDGRRCLCNDLPGDYTAADVVGHLLGTGCEGNTS
ncbi:nitronate monooxygenase [Planomonospora sp. ID67723]|nr:nitronate monooxygenase [Planomonospora sp. ID67723]